MVPYLGDRRLIRYLYYFPADGFVFRVIVLERKLSSFQIFIVKESAHPDKELKGCQFRDLEKADERHVFGEEIKVFFFKAVHIAVLLQHFLQPIVKKAAGIVGELA